MRKVREVTELGSSQGIGRLAKMDGQESVAELDLDWDAIDAQLKLYESGDRGESSICAKMLDLAFQHGYEHCEMEQAEIASQFAIMLTQPAGNA